MTLGAPVIGTPYMWKALVGEDVLANARVTVEWEQSGTEVKLNEYAISG